MNVSKKRWGYLAVAVLILLFAGIGYAFSLFVGAIEQDLGLTRADTSLVFTLCFICFASGSLVTGFLLRRLSPKILLRVGAVMIGAGFLMSAGAARLWQLYFTYSILCGFSIGIAYNVMISMIPLFFHDKVGLATGILLMGFAMSTTDVYKRQGLEDTAADDHRDHIGDTGHKGIFDKCTCTFLFRILSLKLCHNYSNASISSATIPSGSFTAS